MTEQEIALANAKGLETRRRRWEQRNEKNVWLPLRQRRLQEQPAGQMKPL